MKVNLYARVYHVLLWGMGISTALYALGVIQALRHPQAIPLSAAWVLSTYRWGPALRGLARGDATSLLLAATVALILTPVLRVAFSLAAFWADRDYRYVAVTGAVLGIIILTVALGRLGLH